MIFLLLFFGLILRLISLNQSFWLDEATSATLARNFSFNDILTKFSPGDFHPPLYYLTLKAWIIPFGVSEVSTRALSILFVLATIYIVYRLGGVLASLLIATSPLHIYYSQEARMYSMETFLVSLAIFSFVKIIGKGRVGWWIVFAATIALIGMTDYLPLLIIPTFWIAAIIQKKNLNWWFKFIASHIILIIAYIWWFPTFISQLTGGLSVAASLPGWWTILGKTSLKEIALVPVKFMIGRVGFDNTVVYGSIVGVVSLLFGYLIFKARKDIKENIVYWLWLLVPSFLAAIIGLRVSVFSYFRLLFILPAFYLLVAVGLSKVKKDLFPLLLMAVVGVNLIFSLIYLLNVKYQREDWRGLVEKLNSDKDAVAVFPAKSQREAFLYYSKETKIVEPENLNDSYKEVWLLRYVFEITDPKDSVRQKIESLGYNKSSEENFNGVLVWKYLK